MAEVPCIARRLLAGAALAGLMLLGVVLVSFAGAAKVDANLAAVSGPTPYPKRLEEWPGRGQAEVFPWMIENREYFWKQRQASKGAVVFTGDSLIANWKDLAVDFPGLKVANRAIGGDTSRGLLFRFREDVLDLDPAAIVILIGTNDLSARQAPADIAFNVARLLDAVRERHPETHVVLCTVPPRAHPKAVIDTAQLDELNTSLKKLANGRAVTLLDTHELLGDTDRAPLPRYFQPDRMHIAPEGYRRLGQALRGHLVEAGVYRAAPS